MMFLQTTGIAIGVLFYHNDTLFGSTIDKLFPMFGRLIPVNKDVLVRNDNAFKGGAGVIMGQCLPKLPYYTSKTQVGYCHIGEVWRCMAC